MQPLRRLSRSRRAVFALVLGLGVLPCLEMRSGAVVLYETGDPSANTTAPGGMLAGSGWQFEGNFGVFLGTPIAPSFFLTAKHVHTAGSELNFQGVAYPVTKKYHDPNSDLTVCQVTGTFPAFAPLYTRSDETGRQLVVIGRGTQRGSDVFLSAEHKGWEWGTADTVMRWGRNSVSSVESGGAGLGDLLYATFDQDGLPNEAHLSSGDSGGAVFIQDAGTWKLAGISYAVDEVFIAIGMGDYTSLVAAIFDARGFYAKNGSTYTLLAGNSPVPTGFYATRISSNLAWIYSVIDPAGTVAGDGISNLIKYATGMDPLVPATSASLPGREPGYATITFNKQTIATDLTYSIEKTTDLVNWMPADTVDDALGTNGTVLTIKSKVAVTMEMQLFLRLRVTRP
ncbi:MAG: trypsin-like peptidase domain-containing protein [Chthoniobacteraceae bacterium]